MLLVDVRSVLVASHIFVVAYMRDEDTWMSVLRFELPLCYFLTTPPALHTNAISWSNAVNPDLTTRNTQLRVFFTPISVSRCYSCYSYFLEYTYICMYIPHHFIAIPMAKTAFLLKLNFLSY